MKKLKRPLFNDRSRYLIDLVKKNRGRLALSLVCMLIMSAVPASMAYLVKPTIDDVFIGKDVWKLYVLPIVVISVFLGKGIAEYGQEYFMSYVGQRIIRHFRDRLYDHIQDLPLSFFHEEKTGVLMSRITNDVNIVKAMVTSAVTSFVKDPISIVFLTGYLFYLIPELAFYAFVVLPAAFYPIVLIGRRVRRVSTRGQEAMADLSAFLHETFAGTKIVRAFGMEPHEKKRFFEKSKELFRLEIKEARTKALSSPIMEFLGGIGIGFIIWYGGTKVIEGVYSPGTYMSFLTGVFMLYAPIKKLSKLNNAIQKGLSATDRIFDVLETASEIKEPEFPITIQNGPHRVSFDNVTFGYDDTAVLQGINLRVEAGEIVALVGMSGGGKTSLVNLIPRFYDVKQGCIRVDDIDIRRAAIASLRKQISVVTQEPILFNDTVRYNIAYGNPAATNGDIENAARAAYAYDFIQEFPKQFDTTIGELGSRLSGGEKQRICIARALLKDAPILILDEATSALDAESERWVQKALENLMKGRTTFVIAHRLSTIGYAHRIVVLVDGRIVEEGNHEDLMAGKGEYYKLHQMQFQNGGA